jgi:squalene-hopene/tetraprenyl-beta-curcumene cyclase
MATDQLLARDAVIRQAAFDHVRAVQSRHPVLSHEVIKARIAHPPAMAMEMPQSWTTGLEEGVARAWQSASADPDLGSVAAERDGLAEVIAKARAGLKSQQRPDGHWVFELEADATIAGDYVFLEHFLDEIDQALEDKIAVYLRARQAEHGGWPLYTGGDFDISATVKAYYALKLIGDHPDAPHMARARQAILDHGGAARCKVFTRITLALFGQMPWRAVPVMPVEIMLLPRWFPFHLDKVSYWSRALIVPLTILMAHKPRARNPRQIGIEELFVTPPQRERHYITNPTGSTWGRILVAVDRILRAAEPFFPRRLRQRAIRQAVAFITERLNGEDGLGAILPPMAATVMVFDTLGYPKDHPDLVIAKRAVRKLVTDKGDFAHVQPCLSPVWDTGLACHALMEAGATGATPVVRRALDWIAERQVLDVVGDWAKARPDVRPGGWAFEYRNDHYPDVDDTAMILCALHRADPKRYRQAIERGVEWVLGLQSRNGGWGSFDADNTHHYLNNIPFADHGALLDPPTADLTARCISALAQIGHSRDHPAVARALAYLKEEQEADGSWFGRWGTNYVYGTWSALSALNAVGEDMAQPYVRRAVDWLKSRQQADGGWGESCGSYWPDRKDEVVESTSSQTAWALLGLMAAGEVESPAVARGVEYLRRAPRQGAKWDEKLYNAVGFPRVLYLRYHGYSAYFPLWALARYQSLMARNDRRVAWGL